MMQTSLLHLRRVAEGVAQVRGRTVTDVTVRSDFRQLRLELNDGTILLVGIETDEAGRPRLEIDVVHPVEPDRHQLEVRFDAV